MDPIEADIDRFRAFVLSVLEDAIMGPRPPAEQIPAPLPVPVRGWSVGPTVIRLAMDRPHEVP